MCNTNCDDKKSCCFMPMMMGMCVPCNGNAGNGGTGADGKSAYELAVENGFTGTLEEWLESLKGKDGTVFSNPMNFSLEEQPVGVWIDGKTIYQKTFEVPLPLPNNAIKKVEHGIPNIDRVVDTSGFYYNGPEHAFFGLFALYSQMWASRTEYGIQYQGNLMSQGTDAWVTLRYTCTDR